MFDYALAQYAFQLQMVRSMTADIDDVDFAQQAIAGGNHPAWILGHLTFTSDGACKLLGQQPQMPEAWLGLFARGSQPQVDRAIYPGKAELLDRLAAAHAVVSEHLPQAPPELLARPNPLPIEALKALPTVGNLLMHIVTTHEALHLGQLSAWRRATGRAPLF